MTLDIYYETFRVGGIGNDAGQTSFIYDRRWQRTRQAFPVSLSMPLSSDKHPGDVLLPWLMNLLPEGDPLRATGSALGIAQEDVIALLERLGGDTAGALSVGAPRDRVQAGYRPVETEADLERILADLPSKPFLVGEAGVSMSLAGAQYKLPVRADGRGRIAVPVHGAPSTHILKPDHDRLHGSVVNEALCLVLARRLGLTTCTVTTGRAGARTYLLVTRYDRHRRGDGTILRRHQEDFCQALGRPPGTKYEHNQTGRRGPDLTTMIGLVRDRLTPGQVPRFLDAVIFNIAIGNVDSHAKNYSVLYPLDGGPPALAPLYDLMSGLAWPGITQNHAQDVGGQNRGRHINGRHWARLAAESGVNATRLRRRVDEICALIPAEVDAAVAEVAAMPGGGHGMLGEFSREIRERARTVRDHNAA